MQLPINKNPGKQAGVVRSLRYKSDGCFQIERELHGDKNSSPFPPRTQCFVPITRVRIDEGVRGVEPPTSTFKTHYFC